MLKVTLTLLMILFSAKVFANAGFNLIEVNESLINKNSGGISIGNEADLYQQIANEFYLEYDAIGKQEALKVIQGNSLSITGGLNSIGFSYSKAFLNFNVIIDRNLAPDLFDDKRWIVTDTFNIEIDASKVLGQLKKEGAIDMTDENFAAFAGIVFKRKFTWVHFANSYNEGLMANFQKLFMPFYSMNVETLSSLEKNEIIYVEDSLSLKAGGLVSAPLYTGVTGMAGVLAKYERLSRIEIVSMENDTVQVSSEKVKSVAAGFNVAVAADFLNILKMTILSYDFNYQLDSSYKIYLSLPMETLTGIDPMGAIGMELVQILKNREADAEILHPFIISEESKKSQTTRHKYNFLLLGAQKSSKTQQIQITKDSHIKTFFRHYFEKVKYTESLVSRLFASFIYAITHVDISATHLASDVKRVTIEYDSEKNLMDSHGDVDISDKTNYQKLSMSFITDYKTQKTQGMSGKKYRERAKFILERFSGVDPLAISMIDSEHLKAPFHIEGKYQIDIDGIRHLNSLSIDTVFSHIDSLCDEYPKNSFFNFRSLFSRCKLSVQNDYIDYMKDLTHDSVNAYDIEMCTKSSLKYIFFPSKRRAYIKNCLSLINKLPEEKWVKVPLYPLKNLSTNIVNNTYSKVHFYNLFGLKNVFFYGSFDAKTSDERSFTTYFNEGAFKGLGAVDHYMRVENLRAPSSIVVDQ